MPTGAVTHNRTHTHTHTLSPTFQYSCLCGVCFVFTIALDSLCFHLQLTARSRNVETDFWEKTVNAGAPRGAPPAVGKQSPDPVSIHLLTFKAIGGFHIGDARSFF